ncbi:MAG: class I SAM-dependent methyltransferase [Candidatus Parcubacteria bacterium]|nr:class I SAM-dependent methyltransferase [Candidatus Parcubacteria bacterium]
MKRETALKIIKANKILYNEIARNFSETRYNVWPEFEYFKGYLHDGQDVMDLGCGNGRLLELLKDYKVNYLGVDFSENLIREAQSKWPDKHFKAADILELNNLKEKFDLVFCVATLHHIPSDKLRLQVLTNIKNTLKPDGKLLMINWNLWQTKYLKYIIKYTLLKLTDPDKEENGVLIDELDFQDVYIPWQKKYQRYIHAFTERNIAGLLKKAGLEVIKNVSNTRNIITVAKVKSEVRSQKEKV